MSKEKLIRQIEFYQKDLEIKSARALKYYTAFNYLMDHFNDLPDDIKIEVDNRLKNLSL